MGQVAGRDGPCSGFLNVFHWVDSTMGGRVNVDGQRSLSVTAAGIPQGGQPANLSRSCQPGGHRVSSTPRGGRFQ